MKMNFSKYQGAGNDFVIIDNRQNFFTARVDVVKRLCDRHFGIGADGLMLFEKSTHADFHMRYFNSDGNESTMCGNGGRCITLFARNIGLINDSCRFMGVDGEHFASIEANGLINLKMQDVKGVEVGKDYYFLDTGSPHFVRFVEDVQNVNVSAEGSAIRHIFNKEMGGTNVNFIDHKNGRINIRTFERGVEAETLACGTGSTAAVIAFAIHTGNDNNEFAIFTQGGELKIKFNRLNEFEFNDIWLTGPAVHVFDGQVII